MFRKLFFASFATLLVLPSWQSAALADDRPALSLLDADTLIGWDDGAAPRGWEIQDGTLSGNSESSPLLGGWTLGDFEIGLSFSGAKGAGVELVLVPVGLGKEQILTVESPDDDFRQQVTVRREGKKLLLGDGKQTLKTTEVPAGERYGLKLRIVGGKGSISRLTLREPGGESIFSGKDLAGWWTPSPNNMKAWHAEHGEIVKRGGGGNYLRTDKEYANFTLSFQYKMSKGNNSGVGIRTSRSGWPSGDGMELQMLDRPGISWGGNMSIYRNYAPIAVAHKSEQWNHCVIKADGTMISAWINGVLVQHANTFRHPELKHRHLSGWLGFQDHGGTVQLRDLRVLEAPEGLGLAQWTQPATPRGCELVLDRIMSQASLAQHDGTRSGATAAKVDGNDEQVVAELRGPGALVQITPSSKKGRLAFYFDGESKPRFDVPVSGLPGRVPRITNHDWPLLTCVTYEKSLRIVARDADEAEFRIEYVTLPDGVDVQTFTGAQESIPRGWLASIDYRHNHYKYGQHRDNDPRPRQTVQNKKIEPGSSVRLISLDDAGIVHWWKLHCDKSAMNSDDLWIEVRVDGQSQPAIAAPARYLFAAIHAGKRHNNFVMTHRGGYFSRLAMPYGKGLTITAKNVGTKPLSGVGMTVSYQSADDKTREATAGLMRLRGEFRDPRSASASEVLKVTGKGRLIGLVLGGPSEKSQRIGTVKVDGRRQAGYEDLAVDAFLGASPGEQEVYRCLSGRAGQLAWRYLLLAPIEFDKSIELELKSAQAAPSLVLYYADAP